MNCPVCAEEFQDSDILELHVNAHFGKFSHVQSYQLLFSIFRLSFQMQLMMNILMKRCVIYRWGGDFPDKNPIKFELRRNLPFKGFVSL